MPDKEWPRLSETLTGPRSPIQCQGCGATSTRKLARWQEHDQADQREPIIVVLCEPCSSKLIEPHPRLYRHLDWNEPFPGAMLICWDCTQREGVTCTSPLLLRNGGPGLPLPAPDTVCFIDGVRNGRRFGERRQAWSKPTEECVGRTVAAASDAGGQPS